LITIRSTSWSE